MTEAIVIPLKINYVIFTKVVDVRERFDERYVNIAEAKTEGQVEKEKKSLGWFVRFEGSHESLHVGKETPSLAIGDTVKITFEKVQPCPPSTTTSPQS